MISTGQLSQLYRLAQLYMARIHEQAAEQFASIDADVLPLLFFCHNDALAHGQRRLADGLAGKAKRGSLQALQEGGLSLMNLLLLGIVQAALDLIPKREI